MVGRGGEEGRRRGGGEEGPGKVGKDMLTLVQMIGS